MNFLNEPETPLTNGKRKNVVEICIKIKTFSTKS